MSPCDAHPSSLQGLCNVSADTTFRSTTSQNLSTGPSSLATCSSVVQPLSKRWDCIHQSSPALSVPSPELGLSRCCQPSSMEPRQLGRSRHHGARGTHLSFRFCEVFTMKGSGTSSSTRERSLLQSASNDLVPSAPSSAWVDGLVGVSLPLHIQSVEMLSAASFSRHPSQNFNGQMCS